MATYLYTSSRSAKDLFTWTTSFPSIQPPLSSWFSSSLLLLHIHHCNSSSTIQAWCSSLTQDCLIVEVWEEPLTSDFCKVFWKFFNNIGMGVVRFGLQVWMDCSETSLRVYMMSRDGGKEVVGLRDWLQACWSAGNGKSYLCEAHQACSYSTHQCAEYWRSGFWNPN